MFMDKLLDNYDNLNRYPVLDLYLKNKDLFFENYMIIDEPEEITICNKKNMNMIIISKAEVNEKIIDFSIKNSNRTKKKIFSIGKLELYKSCDEAATTIR